MKIIDKPQVFLIASPTLRWQGIERYLAEVGGEAWEEQKVLSEESGLNEPEAETLVEFMGRVCYRSWKPGLNANVTKVRTDTKEYLHNVLKSGHGRLLEHANFSFVFHNVSRILTHELVRHNVGTVFAQESMRFVRLTDIPFWFPEWALCDEELKKHAYDLLQHMETFQLWMAKHFELDEKEITCPNCGGSGKWEMGCVRESCSACGGSGKFANSFANKKHKTSFMRRFAPQGVATGIGATFNIRALRHIIYMRTALAAEEEIRLVMDDVAEIVLHEVPNLLQDYSPNEDREWIPEFMKV